MSAIINSSGKGRERNPEAFILEADLPGVKVEDFKVEIEDTTLFYKAGDHWRKATETVGNQTADASFLTFFF